MTTTRLPTYVDSQGRTVEMTDPNGNVTYTVYNDAFNASTGFQGEVRTYPGWHLDATSGLYTTTGPVQVSRENLPGSYSESLSYAYTPASGMSAPSGADSISGITSLSRQVMNNSGQTIESDSYFNLSGVTYSASSVQFGAAGTNYYASTFAYDENARPNHRLHLRRRQHRGNLQQ